MNSPVKLRGYSFVLNHDCAYRRIKFTVDINYYNASWL